MGVIHIQKTTETKRVNEMTQNTTHQGSSSSSTPWFFMEVSKKQYLCDALQQCRIAWKQKNKRKITPKVEIRRQKQQKKRSKKIQRAASLLRQLTMRYRLRSKANQVIGVDILGVGRIGGLGNEIRVKSCFIHL